MRDMSDKKDDGKRFARRRDELSGMLPGYNKKINDKVSCEIKQSKLRALQDALKDPVTNCEGF